MPEPSSQRSAERPVLLAGLVAAGMLLSRIAGFARQTLFAYVFGRRSDAADAFTQALRIPNFLQNLLGEGVLSASLIPVYAGMLGPDRERADRVARAVLGVLAFVTAIAVLLGVLFAPQITSVVAGGYAGEKGALTVRLVRILFPGVGLLVLSAWCLAILNSHHKFFLSYSAPVCWNLALITVLVLERHAPAAEAPRVAVWLAWGATIGAVLQLGVMVPSVWRLMASTGAGSGTEISTLVRRVLVTSIPVIFTRGVVQVSSFIDGAMATYLGTGAATALGNAQSLYQMPVALFGMAVSSAALPSMSVDSAANATAALRQRLAASQEAIAVLVVPSMVAFLALGDVMIAMLLQHGRFTHEDTLFVWAVLAGSAVGLLATTIGRLYASTFYALGDTTTPTWFAVIRVALVAALGYLLAFPVPRWMGWPVEWGTVGLTISAGMAGWVEFSLLRSALRRRLGPVTLPAVVIAKAWAMAALAAAVATLLRWALPADSRVIRGLAIIAVYGCAYLALAHAAGLLDAHALVRRALRVRRR